MKKLYLLLLAASVAQRAYASQPVTIPLIAEKNIENYRLSLSSSENTRSKLNKVVLGVAATVAAYGAYRFLLKPAALKAQSWWTGSEADQKAAELERLKNVERDVATHAALIRHGQQDIVALKEAGTQLVEYVDMQPTLTFKAGDVSFISQAGAIEKLSERVERLEGRPEVGLRANAVQDLGIADRPLEDQQGIPVPAGQNREEDVPMQGVYRPAQPAWEQQQQPAAPSWFGRVKNYCGFGASARAANDRGGNELLNEQNKDLAARQEEVFAEAQRIQAAIDAQRGEYGYIRAAWETAKAVGGWAVSGLPRIVGTQYAATLAYTSVAGLLPFGSFLKRKVTHGADYLWHPRVMDWMLKKKTFFEPTIKRFVNWTINAPRIDGRNVQEVLREKKDLYIGGRLLVQEIEKILGYMRFVTAQLPEDDDLNREAANVSMETIAQVVNGLSLEINKFLAGTNEISARISVMVNTIQNSLYTVICKMEEFAPVEYVVGYEPMDDLDRYAMYKRYINPDFTRESPQELEAAANAEFDKEFIQQFTFRPSE